MRQRFASKPPPAVAFKGRFGFEALGCSAVRVLGARRELHHVLEFLCFVEFQRQRRDRSAARIGCMDRSRLMPEMVHSLALRHARRTRSLRLGVTIGVQAAALLSQASGNGGKTRWSGCSSSIRSGCEITDGLFLTIRHPERGRARDFLFPTRVRRARVEGPATISL